MYLHVFMSVSSDVGMFHYLEMASFMITYQKTDWLEEARHGWFIHETKRQVLQNFPRRMNTSYMAGALEPVL